MILVATLTASLVTSSGRSAWFVGVLVLMVYLIFAMTLYLLPPRAQGSDDSPFGERSTPHLVRPQARKDCQPRWFKLRIASMTESRANPPLEPGRIVRDVTHANRKGWLRWLPGLTALREVQPVLAAGRPRRRPGDYHHARPSRHRVRRSVWSAGHQRPLRDDRAVGRVNADVRPSRILVLGPDSALAAVILGRRRPRSRQASAARRRAGRHDGDRVRQVCIVAGLARLGFITELLSKPIRYGYMNGIALTVLVSQMPKLLGFSVDARGTAPATSGQSFQAVLRGKTNWSHSRSAPARSSSSCC